MIAHQIAHIAPARMNRIFAFMTPGFCILIFVWGGRFDCSGLK
jgi:hypothetical protein